METSVIHAMGKEHCKEGVGEAEVPHDLKETGGCG